MEAFIGTVMAVGFNYAPRGWAFCNGQLMAISQNSALFALLGTMYGGDGQTTFGLPDLRGRVPVGSQGAGPGISPVVQGEKAGTNNVTVIASGTATATLSVANLPAHTHGVTVNPSAVTTSVQVSTVAGTSGTPAANSYLCAAPAGGPGSATIYAPTATSPVNLGGVGTTLGTGAVSVDATGSGQALAIPVSTSATASIMQPYLGLNYIICLEGIFPSRN